MKTCDRFILLLCYLSLGLGLSSCGIGTTDDAPADSAPPPVQQESFANRCEYDQAYDERLAETTFFDPRESEREPFAAVGALQLSDQSQCSAVLIGEKTVLTAAHCFEHGQVPLRLSFAKEANAPDGGFERADMEVIIHPEFKAAMDRGRTTESHPQLANVDLALIRLARSADVTPIPMGNVEGLQPGKLLAVVGYGDYGLGANRKRFGQSHLGRVVSQEKYGKVTYDNLLLLNSTSGSGACRGDSGGGIFVKTDGQYYLLGIVHGVNNVLYPDFPVRDCQQCPKGIGIAVLVADLLPDGWAP